MAEQSYEVKLDSLRKYIPFLVNMMTELKAKGNREAQLNKIQSLHDMITDTRKKLKIETLNRCEEVLTNIYFKVNPQLKGKGSPFNTLPGIEPPKRSTLPGIESPRSTPASPSPPRDILRTTPVTIPTEKIDAPLKGSSSQSTKNSHLPKVDVYSNVVINDPAKMTKSDIVAKVPDMSKPPISLDDLKTLEEDVQQKITDAEFANASVDELQAYRMELELKLRVDSVTSAMSPTKAGKEDINTTVRNTPKLSKKLSFSESKHKTEESSKASKNSSSPIKETKTPNLDKKSLKNKEQSSSSEDLTPSKLPQKVLKENTSIFGSLLSSIDDKLLEEKKKSKKGDRRPSVTLGKEESGSTNSLSSDKSDSKETEAKIVKNKTKESKDKKSSESHKHRRSSLDKDKHKDHKKEGRKDKSKSEHKGKSRSESKEKSESKKDSSSKEKHKDKQDKKEERKSKDHPDKNKSSTTSTNDAKPVTSNKDKGFEKKVDTFLSDILFERSKANAEKNKGLSKISSEAKEALPSDRKADSLENKEASEPNKSNSSGKINVISNITIEKPQPQGSSEVPVYKRLADKYNPKPKSKTLEMETPDVDKSVSDSIEKLMKVSPAKPLLGDPRTVLGDKVSEPMVSQSNTPGLLTEQTKPVQLPDILQRIFSKPLLGDIIPKGLNNDAMFPLTVQNRTQSQFQMTKPSAMPPPEAPILSPPHRPLKFQPPEPPRSFPNFVSPPHRQEVMPNNERGAPLLPTPGSQMGLLPMPPMPPSLPRGFQEHNPIMDMGYAPSIGTPRMDFDAPGTPMVDFGSPRVDFEPPTHLRNDQFNPNLRFPSGHQERPRHGFNPRNPNFMGQPQFQPEINVYNNQMVHGMGYFGPDVPHYMPDQNFYHERAWNENQRWRADRRPGDPRNYREYKEMRERQEREAKAAQEKQKEIKDPRLVSRDAKDGAGEKDVNARDPRLARESDERSLGEKSETVVRDPRLSRGREKSVDRDKGGSEGYDPRARAKSRDREAIVHHRDRERALSRLKGSTDSGDSRSRTRERESRFDRMYSRTNRARSRSRSRPRDDKSDEDESFISPLDSLYNAGEKKRTGRGYGVQNFKIPRKSRIDQVRQKEEEKEKRSSSNSRKKHIIEVSDESDGSDMNDVDNDVIPDNDSDVESAEEDWTKDSEVKSKTETLEKHKKQKDIGKKVPDLDTSRIKVLIKSNKDKSVNKTDIWQTDDKGMDEADKDLDESDFISEYDREFQLENKGKESELVSDVLQDEKKSNKSSIKESSNTKDRTLKTATKKVEVQVEEPTSSEDVSEKTIKSLQKEADDDNPSEEPPSIINSSSEISTGEPIKKTAESVEADSSRKSDGTLTPQENNSKSDEPSEQNILAHFFENLLKSKNKKDKKTALVSLIETFSDSFDTKQIQKIRKIINVDDEHEEESDEKDKEAKTIPKEDGAVETIQESVAVSTTEIQEEQPEVGSTTEEVSAIHNIPPVIAEAVVTKQPEKADETQVNEITKSNEESTQPIMEELKSDESLKRTSESDLVDSFDSLEPVMVSVGERIKNRKRNTNTPKPRKKGKTELDLLHEDIQDMFIRDGVLTATGKRMCRILKDDPGALTGASPDASLEQPKKIRKKPGPKPKSKAIKEDIQNSMKDIKIVIRKMPDNLTIPLTNANTDGPTTRQLRNRHRQSSYAESDDDIQKGQNESDNVQHLRNRNLQLSYAESDNDSQRSTNDNDTTLPEDNESMKSEIEGELSSESEEENKSQASDDVPKPRAPRRRRVPRWNSGIITKLKKKKPLSKSVDNSPAPSPAATPDPNLSLVEYDFDRLVEPDKTYFYDYTNKTKMKCKLCKYSGHLLTGHYLKEHPQSEVLCSRLAPEVALEAIKDFSVNGKKYESAINMKLSAKYQYACRVCGFTSTTSPIFFYEHVTTHTGEYRHQCGICEYYAVTGKTMAGHFVSTHPDQEKKAIRRTYTLAVVFGYMCGECNFLQLKEKSVEDHANIFHLGEKPKIYKINMSTVLDPIFDQSALPIEAPKTLEPQITETSSAPTETKEYSEDTTANEAAKPPPSPAPKVRKKPGPKPKVKNTPTNVENKNEENPSPLIKKKPGPKSKTMPVPITEHNQSANPITEEPMPAPIKKKPGPKSKTQRAKPASLEEQSTDDEQVNQQQKRKAQTEVASSPTPLQNVDDAVKEAPTRKRRRSLDKLISEDSGDDLDTIITLSSRSSRAAKEKATAKLKTLMESNEGLSTRKKPADTESVRKEKEDDREISHNNESIREQREEDLSQEGTEKEVTNNPPKETDTIQNNTGNELQEEEMLPLVLKDKISAKKDLNVFTCKTDILEEDAKKIEEERLRKMEELNRSIGARTSKLDFVDKLSNRLSSEQSTEVSKIRVKQEPKDDYLSEATPRARTPTMPVLEKEVSLLCPVIRTPPLTKVSRSPIVSKKPVLEENPPPQSSINFRQNKPNSLFSNMIEKLQGKVNEAANQQMRPSVSDQSASEESLNTEQRSHSPEVLISIGDLITATKRDNEIMYSCHANNCYVATKDKMVFQLHCKFGHKDLNMTSSLCEKCGVVIETTPDTSLLENLYDHLMYAHSDCIIKPSATLRMRRLSGDKLSIKQEAAGKASKKPTTEPQLPAQDFESSLDRHVLTLMPAESAIHAVTKHGTTDTRHPSASVAMEAKSVLKESATPTARANIEPLSEEPATATAHANIEPPNDDPAASEATLELSEDNPFSFKIANVMSLAESTSSDDPPTEQPPAQKKVPLLKPLPPLTLIGAGKAPAAAAIPKNHLFVKEAKLSSAELNRPKKAPKALQKFVETPGDLYKCPHFYCMYSTNNRLFLERHLNAHKSDSEAMVPCVYCDMKTPWEHVPMHIDIRHANCRFACVYCLYRACTKEYVCLHQEQVHPDKDIVVIFLPQRTAKRFLVADAKTDCKTLCEPFRCGICKDQDNHPKEYLFETEFANHLATCHTKMLPTPCGFTNCGLDCPPSMMINHWAMYHGICTYQCGYCKTSSKELSRMYSHFALLHSSSQPDILVRVSENLPKDKELGYSKQAFEKLGHIRKIPANISSSSGGKRIKPIKLIQFSATSGSAEEPSSSTVPISSINSEQMTPGTSPVTSLINLPSKQKQTLPVTQTQQPKVLISNASNIQLLVATTTGGTEKLYLVPASMMSPKEKSVTSVAKMNKVVAQTSTASKTILAKTGDGILAIDANLALPNTTVAAITSSNLPQESVKIGSIAIHPLGKATVTNTVTSTSSSHATIAVLSRSIPTTAASSSSGTQRLLLKTATNKVEKATNDIQQRAGSPVVKIVSKTSPVVPQIKMTATIKSVKAPSEPSLRPSPIIADASDFMEESSSQHSSTGLSEDDILQSAIQSILDGDDLSEHSSISEILASDLESRLSAQSFSKEFPNAKFSSTTANSSNSPKSKQSSIGGNDSPTVSRSSTPGSSPVTKTVPPPLVLISGSAKTPLKPVSQQEYPSSPTNSAIQEQNETTPEQVAPVEHVEVTGDIPESTLISEDVDPLNMDPLESNDDSNLDAPLFDDINVGLDSPPEDPLTITPTFNSDLPSTDDPLSIDEGTTAADPLDVTDVKADDSASQSFTENKTSNPLKITGRSMSMVSNSDDESDSSSSGKGKKRGLMGYQLYRCASCNLSFSNVHTFKSHVTNTPSCKKSGPRQYPCVHCEKTLKTPQRLADHVQTHGVQRFACSLCNEKFPTVSNAKLHMKNRHNITQTNLIPLKADRSNMDTDEFMVKPCQAHQLNSKDKEMPSESPKQAQDENTFNPDQIESIPIRQIFSTNVKCGKCSYQTKVRVNIVRHLQMHLEEKAVPDSAPVNPVPCLEKNEKMFDKMINLAASSITTGRMGGSSQEKEKEEEKQPEFILSHRRFVCPAQGCSYLCPEEANLKHHLMALHSDDLEFTCAHCKKKIEPSDPESVIKHFKLHGLHLYKCHYCSFVNHLKHKVEKHITDGHLDAAVKVVTIRCMDSEPQEFGNTDEATTAAPSTSSKFKPWRCCMCKVKCHTREDIQSHIIHRHDIDTQYKCTLCAFKNDDESIFREHFKEKHPNHDIDIIFVYQKVEEEVPKDDLNATPFDTTPLWQRDKPRVRHIRGILFDEAAPEPVKSPKKPSKTYATPSPKVATSASNISFDEATPPVSKSPKKPSKIFATPSPKVTSSTSSTSTSTASKNLFDCIDAVARGTAETLLSKVTAVGGSAKDGNEKSGTKNTSAATRAASDSDKPVNVTEDTVVSTEKKDDQNNEDDDVIVVKDTTNNVIVIDSDESDTEQKTAPKSDDKPQLKDEDIKSKPLFNSKGEKRQGTTDLLHTAVKMAKIEEPEDEDAKMVKICSKNYLMSMYGSFGVPHNKQWKCPKCNSFKSKRVGDFMYHIYKDFNVYRYKCKACSDLSITYKYMVDHIALHPGFTEEIIEPLPPNVKLETWLHMVIREQSLAILKNAPLMKKRPINGPTDITCYFCNEKFMSMPECYEHMLYHWVMMPYQCQHCPHEFYTVYDLKHHHRIEHPDLKLYLEPKGPTISKAVQRFETSKKRPTPKPLSDSPSRKKAKVNETSPKESQMKTEAVKSGIVINPPKKNRGQKAAQSPSTSSGNVISIDDDEDDLIIVSKMDHKVPNEDEVFACDACAYVADTEVLILKHLQTSHGIKTNKFHILGKMKGEISSSLDMACNICHAVFTELKLRRHFLDTHLESHYFSPYRFKCGICNHRYLSFPKVKMHFTRCHPNEQMKYTCVVQSAEKNVVKLRKKLFSCTMCSYSNVSPHPTSIRAHLRGHLRPIVCNYCNARFRYHSEVQSHHTKEHPGLTLEFHTLEDIQKEFTDTLREITSKATLVDESFPEVITTASPPKNVARKSTSAPFTSPRTRSDEEEEYSFYGVREKNFDLSNIVTTFELEGLEYTTTAEQMKKMFNMDTFVDVSDCAVDIIPLDKS